MIRPSLLILAASFWVGLFLLFPWYIPVALAGAFVTFLYAEYTLESRAPVESHPDELEPAFRFPRWKADAHVELPNRERIGLRGPEIEHAPERVVRSGRAA